jgi:nitrate reductase (cytochrome), electron transfer subunit
MTEERRDRIVRIRGWIVVGAITVSFVGFVLGTGPRSPAGPHARNDADPERSDAPLARSHAELASAPWRQNVEWEPGSLPVRAPVTTADAEARAAALARRATRRAFEGAPPTIPHPVSQGSGVECRACHEHGAEVAGRIAPAMSHPWMSMCTQCHVPETHVLGVHSESAAATVDSDFVGHRRNEGSVRHGLGAPPQPLHGRFLRERCLSCHGPSGAPGLQTSHPERTICEQCHATDAWSMQHPGVEG